MVDVAATSSPFGSHLEELRNRVIFILIGVAVAFGLVFAFWADDIVNYVQQIAIIEREHKGELVREQIRFVVINPMEAFGTTMRVSMYAALVFAYPWAMYHIYRFIAPGLYSHERNFFRIAIPLIFILFAAGAVFGRYLLLPISIPFLLDFKVEDYGVEPTYTLGAFLGLVFALTFGLGFVFQVPLIVAPLIRFNLLSPEFFKKKRKYTVLVALIAGALISPTGMPTDMLMAAVPIFVLVEGGVVVGRLWKRRVLKKAQKRAVEAAKRGEMVDPEKLAGGLAVDLEKKLKELASGGARDFARELLRGFRDGGKEAESVFDDDFDDDDEPEVEVKLKEPPAKKKAAPPVDEEPPRFERQDDTESVDEDETEFATTTDEPTTDSAEWPDRTWDDSLSEEAQRYVEDRITQRLEQFLEEELRPLAKRLEDELRRKQRGKGD